MFFFVTIYHVSMDGFILFVFRLSVLLRYQGFVPIVYNVSDLDFILVTVFHYIYLLRHIFSCFNHKF